MPKTLVLLIALFALLVACTSTQSAEDLAATYVAATEEFTTAVVEAVIIGIAATNAAQPTGTLTSVPTKTPTPMPTATATSTLTLTTISVEKLTPTITNTPEPTKTTTPTAADIKAGQLYSAIRNMKYFAEQLVSGLDDKGTGYVACSRELRISVVTNFEEIQKLPTFDDSLLSNGAIGANISYNLARNTIVEDANISQAYNNCVDWLNAGKPTDYENNWGDILSALEVARHAVILVEEALNN